MRKRFTLIEITMTIVILGIIAGIVFMNTSRTKDNTIATHVASNTTIIQKAVDAYYIENDTYPVGIAPEFGKPQLLDIENLSDKYLSHTSGLEKVKGQQFMLDYQGKVWGSTAKNPDNFSTMNGEIRFTQSERAVAYSIYEASPLIKSDISYKMKKVGELPSRPKKGDWIGFKGDKTYLVSAKDRFGLETAPSFTNADEMPSLIQREGKFQYKIYSDETFTLDGFNVKEEKPSGSAITYEFDLLGKERKVEKSGLKIFPKSEKANGIVVYIEMKSNAKKEKPSLLDLQVLYHFEDQKIAKPKIVEPKASEMEVVKECDNTPCELLYFNFSETPHSLFDDAMTVVPSDPYQRGVYVSPKNQEDDPYFVCIEGCDRPMNLVLDHSGVVYPEICTTKCIVNTSTPAPVTPKPSKVTDVIPASQGTPVTLAGWTTTDSFSLFSSSASGQKIRWIEANPDATIHDTENTKIVYRYSYGDITKQWYGSYDNINKLPVSISARVTVSILVKDGMVGKVTEPEFRGIEFVNEDGSIPLDMIRPQVRIVLEKDNNEGRNMVSDASNIVWTLETFDPRNKTIVETTWDGEKQAKYEKGTYKVSAKVRNASNLWSNPAVLSFEVKKETPVVTGFSFSGKVGTKTTIGYTAYDDDEDKIVDVEYGGEYEKEYTTAGTRSIKVRVKDVEGNFSPWFEKKVYVANKAFFYKRIEGEDLSKFSVTGSPLVAVNVPDSSYQGGGTSSDGRTAQVSYKEQLSEMVVVRIFNPNVRITLGATSKTVTGTGWHEVILESSGRTNTLRFYALESGVSFGVIDYIDSYGDYDNETLSGKVTYEMIDKDNPEAVYTTDGRYVRMGTDSNFMLKGTVSLTTSTDLMIVVQESASKKLIRTVYPKQFTWGGDVNVEKKFEWDGLDEEGNKVAKGNYEVKLIPYFQNGNVRSASYVSNATMSFSVLDDKYASAEHEPEIFGKRLTVQGSAKAEVVSLPKIYDKPLLKIEKTSGGLTPRITYVKSDMTSYEGVDVLMYNPDVQISMSYNKVKISKKGWVLIRLKENNSSSSPGSETTRFEENPDTKNMSGYVARIYHYGKGVSGNAYRYEVPKIEVLTRQGESLGVFSESQMRELSFVDGQQAKLSMPTYPFNGYVSRGIYLQDSSKPSQVGEAVNVDKVDESTFGGDLPSDGGQVITSALLKGYPSNQVFRWIESFKAPVVTGRDSLQFGNYVSFYRKDESHVSVLREEEAEVRWKSGVTTVSDDALSNGKGVTSTTNLSGGAALGTTLVKVDVLNPHMTAIICGKTLKLSAKGYRSISAIGSSSDCTNSMSFRPIDAGQSLGVIDKITSYK